MTRSANTDCDLGTPRASVSDISASVEIRVMTYNILYGWRWEQALDLIQTCPADIIALQEVPDEQNPRGGAPASRILRDLELPGFCAMLWGRGRDRIGNLTLVRGRIGGGAILKVPWSRPYGIVNEVEVCGVRLTVANVHLTPMIGPPPLTFLPSEIWRLRETLDLTRRSAPADGSSGQPVPGGGRPPVIALGDFNTFRPAPACWVMHRGWGDCRGAAGGRYPATRPTYGLPFVIDHIFTRGDVAVLEYDVLDHGGSDHRAVFARLRLAS
ncbi:MAG: endonuclease/exonuclease/phosphatase family protein, partial [Phycisphaerae bacterium]